MPHTVNATDLNDWIKTYEVTFAARMRGDGLPYKRLLVTMNGKYAVRSDEHLLYLGDDQASAIKLYNEIA